MSVLVGPSVVMTGRSVLLSPIRLAISAAPVGIMLLLLAIAVRVALAIGLLNCIRVWVAVIVIKPHVLVGQPVCMLHS